MRETLHLAPGHDGWVREYRPAGREHPRHRHEELEFNLVLAGTATYQLDDRRYDLAPQHLVWLFPDQTHLLVDAGRELRMWIGVIAQPALARICRDRSNLPLRARDPREDACRRLSPADVDLLDRLCAAVAARRDDVDPDAANAGLAHVFLESWRRFRDAARVGSRALHPAVARACSLIVEDPAIAVPDLAAACGLSASRLAHRFRAETGTTIPALRNRERLRRFLARREDGRGRRTLLADAFAAGFGSYAQFHRVFVAEFGVGPRAYGVE